MSIIEKAISKFSDLDKIEKIKTSDRVEIPAKKSSIDGEKNSGASDSVGDKPRHRNADELIDYEACLRKAGFYCPADQLQRAVDEYRRIKRPLIKNAFGKQQALIENARLIGITSSVPDEGKTFSSSNIALSLSMERDLSVLLVDTDVMKADTSKTFGLEKKPGLINILQENNANVDDFIFDTNIDNLSILPVGSKAENSTELLSSDKMKLLVNEMLDADENRIILFDMPPLLATAESVVISTYAGQIIVVVEAVRTPKNHVTQALNVLDDSSKAINLVLNKSHRSLGFDYYGDYYGDER